MLSIIGLFAIAFVVVKFFPDILMFTVKAGIVLIGLYSVSYTHLTLPTIRLV